MKIFSRRFANHRFRTCERVLDLWGADRDRWESMAIKNAMKLSSCIEKERNSIMYIQITNRCNMACEHCGMDSTPNGKHMPRKTYEKALELAEQMGEYVFLGGGEPTVHPDFWGFLGLALGASESVAMVTNGKRTEDALKLARLAARGVLTVDLSQDTYHEKIRPEVVKAFRVDGDRWNRPENDRRSIRTVDQIIKSGRAEKNGIYTTDDDCICPEIFVNPQGRIWGCGCKVKSLGTVWEPDLDGFEPEYSCTRGE